MAVAPLSEMRRLRRKYTDRLLTLLAVLLALYMFVFAPLHAYLFIFHSFTIVALLGILAGMVVISDRPVALAAMLVGIAANVVVLLERLFYPPWPYNVYVLTGGWSSRRLYSETAASTTIELSARSCCICLSRSLSGRCS
jgi:hypothetical protein